MAFTSVVPFPPIMTAESTPPTESLAPAKSGMSQRLITGFGVGGFALVAIFTFPPLAAFATWLAVFFLAANEYASIVPPLGAVCAHAQPAHLVPVAATSGMLFLRNDPSETVTLVTALGLGYALVVIGALTTLFGRTDIREGAVAMGFIAFGIPYFAVPPLAMYKLHTVDAWLVFLLVAIVAFGDSAAYFVGRKIGRHKIAPG